MELSEIDIQGKVNYFISEHLPNKFTANTPVKLSKDIWSVEIVLSYPNVGKLGVVGSVQLDLAGNILDHTPIDKIYFMANLLLCTTIIPTLKETEQ